MIENCLGPEELTGIAIPNCELESVPEQLASQPRRRLWGVPGPEELTGISGPKFNLLSMTLTVVVVVETIALALMLLR